MSHPVKVCDDNWHGVKAGHQFEWVNDTGKTCTITKHKDNEFPFEDGPSIVVPVAGCAGTIKKTIGNGHFKYNVDCCGIKTAPKNVLIP